MKIFYTLGDINIKLNKYNVFIGKPESAANVSLYSYD
jgi:hypothetical protein